MPYWVNTSSNDLKSILKGLVTLNLKEYEKNLKMRGFTNITKMVYAFKGKEVKMEIY